MPAGPRFSEAQLRWMARARITDGRLPVTVRPIVCPRYGSEEVCQLCEQRIDRYHLEYGVTDARDGYELAFHIVCYRLWQLECVADATSPIA